MHVARLIKLNVTWIVALLVAVGLAFVWRGISGMRGVNGGRRTVVAEKGPLTRLWSLVGAGALGAAWWVAFVLALRARETEGDAQTLRFVWGGLAALGAGRLAVHSRRPSVALATGVGLVAISGIITVRYRPDFERLFHRDYTAGPSLLEEVRNAPLQPIPQKPTIEGEWPQWRGPDRDGHSQEIGFLRDWNDVSPREQWRRSVGGGYSSFAIVQNRVYTMDRAGDCERVLCLNAATGELIWAYSYPADYSALPGKRYQAGPRATPSVCGDRVYTVGATGVLLCLDAIGRDGETTLHWRHDLIPEFGGHTPYWGMACSPLIENGLVCVEAGGARGSLVAFDRWTGRLSWTALDDPPSYSSPVAVTAAGTRQIVSFTGENLVGLRPSDGQLLWKYGWTGERESSIVTPIVAGDFVFVSSYYARRCALLKLEPTANGRVMVKEVLLRSGLMLNHVSTCVLDHGLLYGFDSSGGRTALKCVDLHALEDRWAARISDDDHLSRGCLLFADGHLIVLTEDGWLLLVEATPQGYKKRGERRVFDGPECMTLPALAAGRLFLRDAHSIVCLDLMAH